MHDFAPMFPAISSILKVWEEPRILMYNSVLRRFKFSVLCALKVVGNDRGDRCLFFLWAHRLFCNVFPFPVCKAQLIGDWYGNRQGALNTIIFLIFRQYYCRTDAPCANRSGGRNTKKTYWRTVSGQLCLLVEGDIGTPIYWRTNAPRANSISAQKRKILQVHRVNRVLGFLSSGPNWDPPTP
jgi:hypothetical protein